MQSNQNYEGMAALFLLAIAWLLLQIFAAVILAVSLIVAVVATIIALCAWSKPLVLLGEEIVTPNEARSFILCGLACGFGAILVTAMAEQIGLPFPLPLKIYPAFGLGGYLYGGARGIELAERIAKARAVQELPNQQEILPPIASPPPYTPPFRFAEWNDRDELR